MPLKAKGSGRARPKSVGKPKHLRRPRGRANLVANVGKAKPKNVGMAKARPKRVGGASKYGGRRAAPKFRMPATATMVKKPTSGPRVKPPAKARGTLRKPTQGPAVPPPKKAPSTVKPTVGPPVAPPPKAPVVAKPKTLPPEPKEPRTNWQKLVVALKDHWGFSSEEAAEDLDVSASTFKKWESGEATPGKTNQEKILAAAKDYSDLELKDFQK